jgi:folate-binding protein YgfZ
MNELWYQHMDNQGAIWHDDQQSINHFGIPEIERHMMKHGAIMTSLAHMGLIRVSGEDAKTFLQSQLTQDVNLVTESQAQLAGYCDPQGNVLGLGLLFLFHDAYYWQVPRSNVLPLLKRLKLFVMRSKVDCEDFSDLLPRFGYAGTHAAQDILVLLNEKLPETAYEQNYLQADEFADIAMIRLPTAHPCALFVGPFPSIGILWDRLETNATKVGSNDWYLMDLAYGIPQVSAELHGLFNAHHLNLDRLGAVSFKKGCYPGQEVIARTHYRGKPTKRLMRFHTPAIIDPAIGEALTVHYGEDRTQTLTVLGVGADLNEGTLLLAIASIKGVDDADGQFQLPSGDLILMEPMGYRLVDLSSPH